MYQINSALLLPFLHSSHQLLLESALIRGVHRTMILMGETARVDYLLGFVDVYHRHVRSDISFIWLDELSHISNVELLQLHFWVDGNVIFFDLGDMACNIDFALLIIGCIHHQEYSRIETIFCFIVLINVCGNQMCGVPSTFVYAVLTFLLCFAKIIRLENEEFLHLLFLTSQQLTNPLCSVSKKYTEVM